MEPKTYSLLFLAALYSATTFAAGFLSAFNFSWLWTGIILGLAQIAFGGYYGYLFFRKAQTKEDQVFDGVIGIFCIIGGLISCIIPQYTFDKYSFFSRFLVTIFVAGVYYVMTCLYWYIPIQKLGNGTIPTLGMTDMKQTLFFFITNVPSLLVLCIAFCINFSSSSTFWPLVLRAFISALLASGAGAAVALFLNSKSSQSGYETTSMQQNDNLNEQKMDEPLNPEFVDPLN